MYTISKFSYIFHLIDDYRFGAYTELARTAYQRIDYFKRERISDCRFNGFYRPGFVDEFDLMIDVYNEFIDNIQRVYKEADFGRKISEEKRQMADHQKRSEEFIDRVFAYSANNIVLRIDLEYLKHRDTPPTLERISKDLDRLLAHMRHNPGFNGLVSYLLAIEYGYIRGVHCHAFFILSSRDRKPSKHIGHAKLIGEAWKLVTNGDGHYYNCNRDADEHEMNGNRGIGAIAYYEDELINNLKKKVIGYLFKDWQFVRMADGPCVRTVRFGQVSEPYPGAEKNRRYENNRPEGSGAEDMRNSQS